MLNNNKPDCALIIETACSKNKKLIIPHDEYTATYYPVDTDDEK